MRVRGATDPRGLSALRFLPILVAIVSILFAGVVAAGEFYSWSDASGTMVLTDDPGRIPAMTDRGPVAVHRFKDTPAPPPHDRPVRVSRSIDPEEVLDAVPEPSLSPPRRLSAEDVEAIDPAELGLPEVLLDGPAEDVKKDYVWVPFVVPVYLGAGPVSGFWCHREAASPMRAFKHFLAQHHVLIRHLVASVASTQRHGDMVYHRSLSPLPATSGNPVYDQIMREQQAMLQRIYARPPSIASISRMPAHVSSVHQSSRIGHSRSGLRR